MVASISVHVFTQPGPEADIEATNTGATYRNSLTRPNQGEFVEPLGLPELDNETKSRAFVLAVFRMLMAARGLGKCEKRR